MSAAVVIELDTTPPQLIAEKPILAADSVEIPYMLDEPGIVAVDVLAVGNKTPVEVLQTAPSLKVSVDEATMAIRLFVSLVDDVDNAQVVELDVPVRGVQIGIETKLTPSATIEVAERLILLTILQERLIQMIEIQVEYGNQMSKLDATLDIDGDIDTEIG